MRKYCFGIICSISIVLFLLGSGAKSQEVAKGELNSWFLQYSRLHLDSKWSVTNEIHYRTGEFLSNPGLILIRPSLDYHLNKEVEFAFGYTYVHADPFEPYSLPIPADEHNIWWQTWIKNKIGAVELQHRIRQEHRWQDNVEQTDEGVYKKNGTNFNNRFRYRFVIDFNLFRFKNGQSVFCLIFDEVWLSQNDKLLFTDLNRNWLYGGLGYRINPDVNIQLGFNYQSDKTGPEQFINSPVIQLSYFQTFTLSKTD
jgi:hypothetical protein